MKNASLMDGLVSRAKGLDKRIIFPEGEDERIIQAAYNMMKLRVCKPILVGNKRKIEENALKLNIPIKEMTVIEPETSPKIKEYAKLYSKITHTSLNTSLSIVKQPLFYAALALKSNDADGMIGGIVYTSGDFIAVSKGIIGIKKGISVPSSYFIMEIPHYDGGENGVLVYADASVNPNPTSSELADIAVTTGETVRCLLGWEPRIAMLSFSTKGSAVHPDVEKVVKAVEIAKKKAKKMYIDGEFQGDAALVLSTAQKKIKGDIGKVAGRANVLIFPDLDAGNISYKLTQILAGANAYGPILQGFNKPLSDLSRGAKVKDIEGVIAIVALIAAGGKNG